MRNLLAMPSLWNDGTASPPSTWDGSKYVATAAGEAIQLFLNSDVVVAGDDVIGFKWVTGGATGRFGTRTYDVAVVSTVVEFGYHESVGAHGPEIDTFGGGFCWFVASNLVSPAGMYCISAGTATVEPGLPASLPSGNVLSDSTKWGDANGYCGALAPPAAAYVSGAYVLLIGAPRFQWWQGNQLLAGYRAMFKLYNETAGEMSSFDLSSRCS